jgi:hypothetical protein
MFVSSRVTRRLGKNLPNFSKSGQNNCQAKKAKQPTLKAYLKVQIIYICYLKIICKNVCVHQVSISPTFYEQLWRQNPFAKKLQTQIVST